MRDADEAAAEAKRLKKQAKRARKDAKREKKVSWPCQRLDCNHGALACHCNTGIPNLLQASHAVVVL